MVSVAIIVKARWGVFSEKDFIDPKFVEQILDTDWWYLTIKQEEEVSRKYRMIDITHFTQDAECPNYCFASIGIDIYFRDCICDECGEEVPRVLGKTRASWRLE